MAKKKRGPVDNDTAVDKKDSSDLSPRDWIKRIKRAKKFRDQVQDKQGWDRLIEEYEGEYKINNQAIKAPPINLVFGYVDTQLSKIFFRSPYISINAKGGEFIERAHILEKVINYYKNELSVKQEAEKAVIDGFLVGHGWIKTGYTGEIESGEASDTEYVKDGQVYVCYVPWEDMLFDVTLSKDPPHDCKWVAQRIIKPVDEWKESKLYSNTESIKSNVSTTDLSGKKIEENLKDADIDLFEGWEIWDMENKKVLCVAESYDNFLRESDWPYEMDGYPYCMLKFNRINKKPYPLSDIYLIEPQILEKIKLRSGQINHIKRWSRQLNVEKGAMSREEMEKFAQGIDGGITQREKGFAPPVPIQYAPMQDEIFVLDNLIGQDMDSVIGQNEVDRGGQAKTKTKTKYELQEQLQGTSTRQARRIDKLEDFLEEIFRKVIQLLKQFQDTPMYVAITGMTPAEIQDKMRVDPSKLVPGGIEFTKEDIKGEFDVEVKAGSTLPMNKDGRMKTMQGLFELLPKLGMKPDSPVMMALLKELFRELDMQEVSKAFEDMMKQVPKVAPAMPGPQAGVPGGAAPVAPVAPGRTPGGVGPRPPLISPGNLPMRS